MSDTDAVAIEVLSPPVNPVPGHQIAAEDVARVIGGVSVADDNAVGVLTVVLTVEHGTLAVNSEVAGANGTVLGGNGQRP